MSFEELARKRDSLLRKWTTAGNEVATIFNLGVAAKTDPTQRDAFRGRYNILEKFYSRFDQLSDDLTDMNPDFSSLDPATLKAGQLPSEFPETPHKTFATKVRAAYMDCHTMYARFFLATTPPAGQNLSVQNVSSLGELGGGGQSFLPKVPIPKFDGAHENWVAFRDVFKSLVHENSRLSKIERFHQLIGALQGSAKSVLAGLPITEETYDQAWESLTEAYENKRVLATVYLNKIFSFQPIQGKPTPEGLRNYLAQIADTVAAFKLLKIENGLDFVLFTLSVRNLPQQIREEFEFRLKKDEFPSTEQLTKFVRERQLAVQLADPTANFSSKNSGEKVFPKEKPKLGSYGKSSPKTSLMTGTAPKTSQRGSNESPKPAVNDQQNHCVVCNQLHTLFRCTQFNSMTPNARADALRSFRGCKVCLTPRHTTASCRSSRLCRLCNEKHNAMICTSPTQPANSTNLFGTTLQTAPTDDESRPASGEQIHVVLATAWVKVRDARGQYQKVRAVLDSASQYSYLTHKSLSQLGFTPQKTARKISCLGGVLFDAARGVAQCELTSNDETASFSTEMVIVKNITSFLPSVPVPTHVRSKYQNFELADKFWFRPQAINMLIGADLFAEVVSGQFITIAPDLPKLLPTVFGHVILGRYEDKISPTPGTSLFSRSHCEDNLCFDLQKFWQIEEVPNFPPAIAPEDSLAEELFEQTTQRLPDGRFQVRLPFRASPPPDLSTSEEQARKRFLNLESKLQRNPQLNELYAEFMREYQSLGHMMPTKEPSKYVIPHHGVFNKIKLRVVFDGSAKTPNGSINEHLLIGPPLQNDLRNILINFRVHQVAFVADVVKMYRQIQVDPQDQPYQHIFWREKPSDPLEKFRLTTVTYGLSSSPYQALKCVKALELENRDEFPLASEVLSKDLYVDDVVTGERDVTRAKALQNQLIHTMKSGGFQLAKWASNRQEILENVPSADRQVETVDLSDQEPSNLKVLGLKWEPKTDEFSFAVQIPSPLQSTKRAILSTVARIFDPIGLLSATTIKFKILLQKLWLANVGWDEQVPAILETIWKGLVEKLEALSSLRVPRCITLDGHFTYQLVGFSDASSEAYCATIFLRIIQGDTIRTHLLTAKTKVAPTKTQTVPKLELCGADLLAKLTSSLTEFQELLGNESLPSVYYTDSAVVLAWIKNIQPNRLKVFVANRVANIHRLTHPKDWHHVAGADNPSDVGSRGISPDQLATHSLWWHGPSWLKLPQSMWPISKVEIPPTIPELKGKSEIPVPTLFSCSAVPDLINWMGRFSSYRTLIRVIALILRTVYNRRHKDTPRTGEYLLREIVQAFFACVRMVQSYHFFQGEPPNSSSLAKIETTYKSLSPFLDAEGILRVGGRLRHAQIGYDQQHQVLLPHNSKFTVLIIEFYHLAYKHPGPSLLQALLQKRIWVPGLRRLTRTASRRCVRCFKLRADAVIPSMGDLPTYRLSGGRAFEHTGADFCGPFHMKESNRRKAQISKVYLCVFVCMTTKAIHVEVVSDLTSGAFLAAFTRFISRRGKPSHCYSDNGGNFVGASRELKALHSWFHEEQNKNDISNFCSNCDISWSFTPPYTPHYGGLWEGAVKSIKRQLRLAAGDLPLTFEELTTLTCQIEAVLNSRPLCPLSDQPEEADYLSPGHFLIGQPLVATSEPTLLDTKLNQLSRWQLVKRTAEQIWSRWRIEYLSTLQKRTKWHRDPSEPPVQLGDLVLIKTKDAPPLRWPTARVIEEHPGSDGKIRVVTIKTPEANYRRSVANLVPLLPLKNVGQGEDVIPPE